MLKSHTVGASADHVTRALIVIMIINHHAVTVTIRIAPRTYNARLKQSTTIHGILPLHIM